MSRWNHSHLHRQRRGPLYARSPICFSTAHCWAWVSSTEKENKPSLKGIEPAQAHPQGSEPERPAEAPAGTYLKQAGLGPGSGCGTEDPSWLCLAHPHRKPPGRRRGHLGVWREFTIRAKGIGRASHASPISPWFFLPYPSSYQDSEGAP